MASAVVEILKRVGLMVQVNAVHGPAPPPAERLDFIFGVASGGLSPFECDISEKPVGHEAMVPIDPRGFQTYFEHLAPALLHAFPDLLKGEAASLSIRVASVTEPDRREVIRAMAVAAEGCGGGCGCGCGSH